MIDVNAQEKKIEELISSMTLQEKARQLTQINAICLNVDSHAEITGNKGRLGVSERELRGVGSVLNFTPGGEMEKVQHYCMANNPRQIPVIFMMDVIHGYRTLFPVSLGLGASFDVELVEACAEMSAREARADGVHVTFAPMVDLVRDARWGRVMESTGEDPYLNGEMGKAFIRGFRKGGLGSCVKHFAGYGAAESGKDYGTTDISDYQLREFYLRGYQECLKEKPEMVMSSFNMLNGKPVNGHKELLVDLLRNEWGFDGVLVSDYNAIREMITHGYLETEKECACEAINHEIDLEMMSATYIKYLPELVAEGKISEDTVNRMLRRVLTLKAKLGILDDPMVGVDFEKAAALALCDEHRALARKAAEKSAVLLKNDGVLPLNREKKIALVGPFAAEQNIIGLWKCHGKPQEAVSVKQGLECLLGREIPTAAGCSAELIDTDISGIGEAVNISRDAEVILACIGELSTDSGEGASRADLCVTKPQITLLKELRKLGKPVVSIVFGGRPQVLTEVERLSDAILYMWQPGTEGGNAVANLIFGEAMPSGKLTMSFPRSTGQCPIYYNHFRTGRPKMIDDMKHNHLNNSYRDELNAPLYPFGYGLSYTEFILSDVQLSSDVLHKGESVAFSALLENVGSFDGEEVVQLYIQDHFASRVRPVQELKGYQKVFLKAGEKKRVSFAVTEDMLAFYGADGEFKAEEGTFSLMIGNSSVDVQKRDLAFRNYLSQKMLP